MSDRLKGCVVSFETDIRDDDAEHVLNAIRMIKGVSSVTENLANPDDSMNRARIINRVRDGLYDKLEEILGEPHRK